MFDSLETVDNVLSLLENGVINVANKFQEINATNYFPVNDGDTGSNLKSTLITALNKVKKSKFKNVKELLTTFCEGLLIGAVGNSGIAFARSFCGFCENFKINTGRKNVKNWLQFISAGWSGAVKNAYSTFDNIQEGTMCTLIKESASHLNTFWIGKNSPTIKKIFFELYRFIEQQLPKLIKFFLHSKNKKLLNHIDAGALGFFYFVEGLYLYVCDQKILHLSANKGVYDSDFNDYITNVSKRNDVDFTKNTLGYCIEKIIQIPYRSKLEDVIQQLKIDFNKVEASSIIISKIHHLVKIHCHHYQPAKVFSICSGAGAILKSKVENMALQNYIFHENSFTNQQISNNKNTNISDNNVICFSSCKSWAKKLKKLKVFGHVDVTKNLQTNEKCKILFKKVQESKHEYYLVLVHNDNTFVPNLLKQEIKELFAKSAKKYHLFMYSFSYECYMAAASYISLKPSTKENFEKSLYSHPLWSSDNVVVYLVPENKKIKIIINGVNYKQIRKISDLKIVDLLKYRKRSYSLDDFEKVIISAETESDEKNTKFLHKLFKNNEVDLNIEHQKGDELAMAYTILIY